MKVYLAIEELRIAHGYRISDGKLLEGWINEIEIGMIYRQGNKFYRIDTQDDIEKMSDVLLAGKICGSNREEDSQPRVVKVHIVQENVRPKRGDYFWNFMGGKPELYKKGVDYGVFDPGKAKYDDKVVLLHEDMKNPLELANRIIEKDPKLIDDRNKFDAKILDGDIIIE